MYSFHALRIILSQICFVTYLVWLEIFNVNDAVFGCHCEGVDEDLEIFGYQLGYLCLYIFTRRSVNVFIRSIESYCIHIYATVE